MIRITGKAGMAGELLIRQYKRKIDSLRLVSKARARLTYIKPSKKRREARNKAILTQRFYTKEALA